MGLGLNAKGLSMRKLYATLPFAIFLLCGCKMTELSEERTVQFPVFGTSFEEAPRTRTYVDSDLVQHWEYHDYMSVFTSTLNAKYMFDGADGDVNGTISLVSAPSGTGDDISTIYAVYPYSSTISLTEGEHISLTLPDNQKYAKNSFCTNDNTMVAVASGPTGESLAFKNVCGYLVVNLYGDELISSVSIHGNNGEKLAGPATVTAAYGAAPTLEFGEDATEEVILNSSDPVEIGASASKATQFWLVLPPVTFTNGFTVTVTNSLGCVMTVSTTASRTIARNRVYRMEPLEAVCETIPAEPTYVDLGLSVPWATFNLGAREQTGYGDYYAWAETDTHYKAGYAQESPQNHWKPGLTGGYSVFNYAFEGEGGTVTKYCITPGALSKDFKTVLEADDDAAHAQWGGSWRLPTDEEWTELITNCTWTWTTSSGINGYEVTSNVPGHSSDKIFLPAAGYRGETSLSGLTTAGYYWSSSLYHAEDRSDMANQLDFTSTNHKVSHSKRPTGYSIRPVYGEYVAATAISLGSPQTIEAGGHFQIEPAFTPSNTTVRTLHYSSSNTAVATVSQTGMVDCIAEGTAVITATWAGYLNLKATLQVTVTPGFSPSYVDLGLSVKWATFNVGATNENEFGDYYAWGEVEPYYTEGNSMRSGSGIWRTGYSGGYTWSNYGLCNGTSTTINKYCTDSNYGEVDNLTVLDPEDDAATVVWGEDWRMPTDSEWTELRTHCTWTYLDDGGFPRYRVRSNIPGYTTQEITIPIYGWRGSITLQGVGSGYYWSSSLYSSRSDYAWAQNFNHDGGGISHGYGGRCAGRFIRPVRNEHAPTEGPQAVDLGLTVKWASYNIGAETPEGYGDYYAWGELSPHYQDGYANEDPQAHWKSEALAGYRWTHYSLCNGDGYTMTKYCTNNTYGSVDGRSVLLSTDDVARQTLGGTWRMPTKAEWQELFDNCTWLWTTRDGVEGNLVTSNVPGYESASIFLPATGVYSSNKFLGLHTYGSYWASTLHENYSSGAHCISAGEIKKISYESRCHGLSVRAVKP